MDEEEFLKKLSKTKKLFNWKLTIGKKIRAFPKKEVKAKFSLGEFCPITCVFFQEKGIEKNLMDYPICSMLLGFCFFSSVAASADYHPTSMVYNADLRNKILKAVGLKEQK